MGIKKTKLKNLSRMNKMFTILFLCVTILSFSVFASTPVMNSVDIIYNSSIDQFKGYSSAVDGDNDSLGYDYVWYYENGTEFLHNYAGYDYSTYYGATSVNLIIGSIENGPLSKVFDGNTSNYVSQGVGEEFTTYTYEQSLPDNYINDSTVTVWFYSGDTGGGGASLATGNVPQSCIDYAYSNSNNIKFKANYEPILEGVFGVGISCLNSTSYNLIIDLPVVDAVVNEIALRAYEYDNLYNNNVTVNIDNINVFDVNPTLSVRAFDGSTFSDWLNYSFTESYDIVMTVNDQESIDFVTETSKEIEFVLLVTQNSTFPMIYTLSDNVNNTYASISYNQTNFTIQSDSTELIGFNVTTNSTSGNTVFNITATDANNVSKTFSFNLTIAENVATLDITPTTLWSSLLYNTQTVSNSYNLSVQDYNASGCSVSATDSLSSFISINDTTPFNLSTDSVKQVLVRIISPSTGIYTGNLILTCTNASSGGLTVSASKSVQYIIISQDVVSGGGGGGGGGTTIINLENNDTTKRECNINVTPSVLNVLLPNKIMRIDITNNDEISFDPAFNIEYKNGTKSLITNLMFTNTISSIDIGATEYVGLKLNEWIPTTGTANATMYITSSKCQEIIVPIYVNTNDAYNNDNSTGIFASSFSFENVIKYFLGLRLFNFEIDTASTIGKLASFTLSVVGLSIITSIIILGFTIPSVNSKNFRRSTQKKKTAILIKSGSTWLVLSVIFFVIYWMVSVGGAV